MHTQDHADMYAYTHTQRIAQTHNVYKEHMLAQVHTQPTRTWGVGGVKTSLNEG